MNDPVTAYLDHRFNWRPVDATFMGATGYDHRLPRTGAEAVEAELAELEILLRDVEAAANDSIDPIDRQMLLAEMHVEIAALASRPRHRNPAWHTAEAAFGLIALLLPQTAQDRRGAVADRLAAIPQFLANGRAAIGDHAVPAGWISRAIAECASMARFLRYEIRLHEDWHDAWISLADTAAHAFERYAAALSTVTDTADSACGADHLSLIMREQHRLGFGPDEAVQWAMETFESTERELVEMARAIDPESPWQDQIAALSSIGPDSEAAVMAEVRDLDTQAADAASGAALMTPDRDYGLDYRFFPDWTQRIAKDLYFLFYRSPPALAPGSGSVYWVNRAGEEMAAYRAANSTAMLKTIHAIHHGRVGHHTQNAAARRAPGRIAKLAGTDCAMGLAFLGSGTLIEGWACYVEDLLIEAEGFYSPAELLLLKGFERRNAASVLVDVNISTGAWSLAEAEQFCLQKAHFAPGRVAGEMIRNSMFPGSKLMYALGVEGIRKLRGRWKGETADFHDRLLSLGHVPLSAVEAAMAQAGELRG